jgi:hypothetical protein
MDYTTKSNLGKIDGLNAAAAMNLRLPLAGFGRLLSLHLPKE